MEKKVPLMENSEVLLEEADQLSYEELFATYIPDPDNEVNKYSVIIQKL